MSTPQEIVERVLAASSTRGCIAYVRTLRDASGAHNQIFVVPTAR